MTRLDLYILFFSFLFLKNRLGSTPARRSWVAVLAFIPFYCAYLTTGSTDAQWKKKKKKKKKKKVTTTTQRAPGARVDDNVNHPWHMSILHTTTTTWTFIFLFSFSFFTASCRTFADVTLLLFHFLSLICALEKKDTRKIGGGDGGDVEEARPCQNTRQILTGSLFSKNIKPLSSPPSRTSSSSSSSSWKDMGFNK